MVLEFTERTVGTGVISQARSAGLDGGRKHILDGRQEHARAFARNGRGGTFRRDAGTKQRLAHIDVSEARDDALIEESGLDRCLLSLESFAEIGRVEFLRQRFDAETFE